MDSDEIIRLNRIYECTAQVLFIFHMLSSLTMLYNIPWWGWLISLSVIFFVSSFFGNRLCRLMLRAPNHLRTPIGMPFFTGRPISPAEIAVTVFSVVVSALVLGGLEVWYFRQIGQLVIYPIPVFPGVSPDGDIVLTAALSGLATVMISEEIRYRKGIK